MFQVDLWKCVQEAACTINAVGPQLAVMRDPRPATVSAYFHLERAGLLPNEDTVDQYFQRYLGLICQWISIRYFFFTTIVADQSELFWYGDHEDDPFDWHERYLALIGLNLPVNDTLAMARAASEGDFSGVLTYKVKGVDAHPGGLVDRSNSTFEDELGEESRLMMDDVLRRWLPPVVLRRLGLLLP